MALPSTPPLTGSEVVAEFSLSLPVKGSDLLGLAGLPSSSPLTGTALLGVSAIVESTHLLIPEANPNDPTVVGFNTGNPAFGTFDAVGSNADPYIGFVGFFTWEGFGEKYIIITPTSSTPTSSGYTREQYYGRTVNLSIPSMGVDVQGIDMQTWSPGLTSFVDSGVPDLHSQMVAAAAAGDNVPINIIISDAPYHYKMNVATTTFYDGTVLSGWLDHPGMESSAFGTLTNVDPNVDNTKTVTGFYVRDNDKSIVDLFWLGDDVDTLGGWEIKVKIEGYGEFSTVIPNNASASPQQGGRYQVEGGEGLFDFVNGKASSPLRFDVQFIPPG